LCQNDDDKRSVKKKTSMAKVIVLRKISRDERPQTSCHRYPTQHEESASSVEVNLQKGGVKRAAVALMMILRSTEEAIFS